MGTAGVAHLRGGVTARQTRFAGRQPHPATRGPWRQALRERGPGRNWGFAPLRHPPAWRFGSCEVIGTQASLRAPRPVSGGAAASRPAAREAPQPARGSPGSPGRSGSALQCQTLQLNGARILTPAALGGESWGTGAGNAPAGAPCLRALATGSPCGEHGGGAHLALKSRFPFFWVNIRKWDCRATLQFHS